MSSAHDSVPFPDRVGTAAGPIRFTTYCVPGTASMSGHHIRHLILMKNVTAAVPARRERAAKPGGSR